MSWTNNDGLRLAVNELGAGQPFLFQHGLCGDAGQTAGVFPQDIGWKCLTLECRGHGRSEPGNEAGFSIANFTDDIASFIDDHKLGPVVLGGISMGAAIALKLAVIRPDLVRALVLARPAWAFEPAPPNLAPMAVVGKLLAEHEPETAVRIFESSALAQELSQEAPDNLISLQGFFKRQPIAVTRELLVRISTDGPGITETEAAEISVPTLVLGHQRDFVHPFSLAEVLAQTLLNARLFEITPKAEDSERYTRDFQVALTTFLHENSL